jgi:hypothetical protein
MCGRRFPTRGTSPHLTFSSWRAYSGSLMNARAKVTYSYLLLAVIGVVVFGGIASWETWQLLRARNWVETSASIRTGGTAHQLGKGGGYYHWWRYSYEWEGRDYASERVRVGRISGAPHPPRVGTRLTCFVNPANPAEACVYRSWTWGLSFFWVVTLLCALLPWFEPRQPQPVIPLSLEPWRNRRQQGTTDGEVTTLDGSKSPPT